MRLWNRLSRPTNRETDIELRNSNYLERFEVEFDPPPPFLTRVKQASQKVLKISPQARKCIIAIFLDLVCTFYQAIDAYKQLFPGSKIAANILLNGHTNGAWNAFFWLLAVAASIFNMLAVTISMAWLNNKFGLVGRMERLVKYDCLKVMLYLFLFLIVLPTLVIGPLWITFALRYAWQAIAWENVCADWDYTVLLDGVNWVDFLPHQSNVGTATILATQGNFTIQLLHDVQSIDIYTFNVSNSFNMTPAFSSIIYNLTSLTYTIANVTNFFNMTPNLSFPSLNVNIRDPSIPFIRTDQSYPPSADLIHRNGTAVSKVLSTMMLDFPDCVEMKACGMQDRTGAFQIVLGVVMIEQFKASLYCTVPSNGTVQGV